jgi:hypothetical protein
LPIGESELQVAYMFDGEIRTHLTGYLNDGMPWGPLTSLKVRRNSNAFYKVGEKDVEIRTRTGETSTSKLFGFNKYVCSGVHKCTHLDCPHLLFHREQNAHYARKGGTLVCQAKSGKGCGRPMSQETSCEAQKFRVSVRDDHGNDYTAIIYNGSHCYECSNNTRILNEDTVKAEEFTDLPTIGARVTAGVDAMMLAVVKGDKGESTLALQSANRASALIASTAPDQMARATPTSRNNLKTLSIETVVKQLKDQMGCIIVPYHCGLGGLSAGPPATVTLHGCCRTTAEWAMVSNDPSYRFCATNLMLACGDDFRVHQLLDPMVVSIMDEPFSFDVQHPNKISAHFSMGYFVYMHAAQRLCQLAMVMIPASDGHNGHSAKCGDNTEGNTNAKVALDLALRRHLQVAYPHENWNAYSYAPRVARVSDEGHAGIAGMRSTDGNKDVAESSCAFHFKQSLKRIEKDFVDKQVYKHVASTALQMVNEDIAEIFWGQYCGLLEYVNSLPKTEWRGISALCEHVLWHFSDKPRRERMCKAFKPMGSTASSVISPSVKSEAASTRF